MVLPSRYGQFIRTLWDSGGGRALTLVIAVIPTQDGIEGCYGTTTE